MLVPVTHAYAFDKGVSLDNISQLSLGPWTRNLHSAVALIVPCAGTAHHTINDLRPLPSVLGQGLRSLHKLEEGSALMGYYRPAVEQSWARQKLKVARLQKSR